MKIKFINLAVLFFTTYFIACGDGNNNNNNQAEKCKDVTSLDVEIKNFSESLKQMNIDAAKSSSAKLSPLCDKLKMLNGDLMCKIFDREKKVSGLLNLSVCKVEERNNRINTIQLPEGTKAQCEAVKELIADFNSITTSVLKNACPEAFKYDDSKNYRCPGFYAQWVSNEDLKATCKEKGINP